MNYRYKVVYSIRNAPSKEELYSDMTHESLIRKVKKTANDMGAFVINITDFGLNNAVMRLNKHCDKWYRTI